MAMSIPNSYQRGSPDGQNRTQHRDNLEESAEQCYGQREFHMQHEVEEEKRYCRHQGNQYELSLHVLAEQTIGLACQDDCFFASLHR